MADYNKVGLLTFSGRRILMCRKNNTTSRLILPGGCLEPGESNMQCLERELREELGDVQLHRPFYLGVYEEEAACDDPSVKKTLNMKLYQGELSGRPVASSEIVELVWFGPHSDRSELTPIMVNHIIPDLVERNILPWPL